MKYSLFSSVLVGIMSMTTPAYAQFSSFGTGSENCANVCVKVDVGSVNNENSFNSGFSSDLNSGSSINANNIRWQVGVVWKPNSPEVTQAEGERTKQRLEDNRSLMTLLAEAIAQNKTEMAQGLAILLAPRLGYGDHRKLIADLKEGANMKVASTKVEVEKSPPIDVALPPVELKKVPPVDVISPPVESKKTPPIDVDPTPIIELQ
jgi:hypothetical protein